MPRSKRQLLLVAKDTLTPPYELAEEFTIARVAKNEGCALFTVILPSGKSLLVELPAKFCSSVWIRRGSYVVVVDSNVFERQSNKIGGSIANIVGDERAWRKMSYWPDEFSKKKSGGKEPDQDGAPENLPLSEFNE